MNTIEARHTGQLSVAPRGRVGTYERARAARRCRARHHWVIEEGLVEVKVTRGMQENGLEWEQRTKSEEREDLGQFKTKTAAIKFLSDYAAANGLPMQGNITGYPWLQL